METGEAEKLLGTVYKPHSVRGTGAPVGDHLSRQRVTTPLYATYPELWGDEQSLAIRRWFCPLLGLAPGGGYLAIHITVDAGGLLHHLFTITPAMSRQQRDMAGAVCFCGPYPAGSLLAEDSRPGCYPTPCSMECGLSSTPTRGTAIAQPT